MVVEDVVGRHCHRGDERVSGTCRDRHPEVADHLNREASGVNRFGRHGDLASTQDTVPLLRDDLGEMTFECVLSPSQHGSSWKQLSVNLRAPMSFQVANP